MFCFSIQFEEGPMISHILLKCLYAIIKHIQDELLELFLLMQSTTKLLLINHVYLFFAIRSGHTALSLIPKPESGNGKKKSIEKVFLSDSEHFRLSEGGSSNTYGNAPLFVRIILLENEHILKSYRSFLHTPFSEQKLLEK